MWRGSGPVALAIAVCGRGLAYVPRRPGARRASRRCDARRRRRETPEGGVAGGDEWRGQRDARRSRWGGRRGERGRRGGRLSGQLWGQDLAGRRPWLSLGVAHHRRQTSDRRQLDRPRLLTRPEWGRQALGRDGARRTAGDLVIAN